MNDSRSEGNPNVPNTLKIPDLIGGKNVHVARSDGSVEEDWQLKSLGTKLAVVEKSDRPRQVLRKLIPIDKFTSLNNIDPEHVNEYLAKQQLKKSIPLAKQSFEEAQSQGKVQEVAWGAINDSWWQQVIYGKPIPGKNFQLYRGYLMIEPEDLPEALQIVSNLAQKREQEGKSTEFKWLLKTEQEKWMQKETTDPNFVRTELGDYQYLEPTDPRLVLYSNNTDDIQHMLRQLAQDEKMATI
jgi:hypothetical protein